MAAQPTLIEICAEARPLLVAPLGATSLPLPTAIGRLDWMMGHPLGEAMVSGFRDGADGERLWLPPGELPIAGMLVVGLGAAPVTVEGAVARVLTSLPDELPGRPDTVVLLPPHPLASPLESPWPEVAAGLLEGAGNRHPFVRRWMGLDWEDTLV